MQELNIEDFLQKNNEKKEKHVGYVTIIGRPNVWKSTFLNTLIWEKISITSQVPQTTRNKILAIYNSLDTQIVFLDTPWIHKSEKKFNLEINSQAKSAINEADVVLYFIDGSRKSGEEEDFLRQIITTTKKPVIEVVTKSDLPQKHAETHLSADVLYISSETKEWFEDLLDTIKKHLKHWPILYPEDIYTQQELFFRVSEIVREKAFYYAKQELPHSIYVHVEEIDEEAKMYKISAYIYVETESQKYITIWKQGSLIKTIGTESRIDLEKILWKKVFLTVRVKVRKNWRKDENFIKRLLK